MNNSACYGLCAAGGAYFAAFYLLEGCAKLASFLFSKTENSVWNTVSVLAVELSDISGILFAAVFIFLLASAFLKRKDFVFLNSFAEKHRRLSACLFYMGLAGYVLYIADIIIIAAAAFSGLGAAASETLYGALGYINICAIPLACLAGFLSEKKNLSEK